MGLETANKIGIEENVANDKTTKNKTDEPKKTRKRKLKNAVQRIESSKIIKVVKKNTSHIPEYENKSKGILCLKPKKHANSQLEVQTLKTKIKREKVKYNKIN